VVRGVKSRRRDDGMRKKWRESEREKGDEKGQGWSLFH